MGKRSEGAGGRRFPGERRTLTCSLHETKYQVDRARHDRHKLDRVRASRLAYSQLCWHATVVYPVGSWLCPLGKKCDLVITRSIVSASRSNHRRSPQCSECRRLIMPIGTATGRMWTSTWAAMAGSHGRLGDGRSRCDHELRSSFRLRSCPTVSRGHLESGDSPAVHRFLGFPRPASGALHHFLARPGEG